MSEELKPCPMCGSPEVELIDSRTGFSVRCWAMNCDAALHQEDWTEEAAVQLWNRRAPITLDQATQVLAEAGMVAVPVEQKDGMQHVAYCANGMLEAESNGNAGDAKEWKRHLHDATEAYYDNLYATAQDKPDA